MRAHSRAIVALLLLLGPQVAEAGSSVHTTFLWHLEQPIYWPAPNAGGQRYQTAWDSIQAKRAGAAHPQNDLDQIFGLDDRVAAYQFRPRDAVQAMLGLPEAGAQVSYSGGLIENIASLGAAGQLGYGAGWMNGFREARNWTTAGGHPRLDIVQFPFHHALIPLIDSEVLRMELRLYAEVYSEAWGAGSPSRGLFPSEMAFSPHVIPALVAEGIEWVVVSNAHLSRACEDYPFVAGSGGDNIPPPNRADVRNPAQGNYNRISIDRGVSPANAVPFSYQPHYARFVDPDTGSETRIVVVPAAQSESWQDGYSCFGRGPIDALAPRNDPAHPMLVLLAHDGDNAFGGGYSYYLECTPNFVQAAAAGGYTPSTVAQYLADHPVAADDVVHVESGAWVNADGDFGAPSFWNWNWPLVNRAGQVDLAEGWAEDERNWAVITAATNVVVTASELEGPPDMGGVLHPDRGSGALEKAWHYLLGALNSGYMYYGKSLDMELKPVVACNEAVQHAESLLAGASETTGPTVWLPQRYPDNPGGLNFGTLYRYQQVTLGPEFWVWTFVHDVSGLRSVVLKVREDRDGRIPLQGTDNETYAGGAGVGAWRAIPMTGRAFPTGNVFDDPEIDSSILPERIADVYYVEVNDYDTVMLDYYVEATDERGNVTRSPIQHVYVGDAEGPPPDPAGVHWVPARPWAGEPVQVYAPSAGMLHWGVNGWLLPAEEYWPAGTVAWSDGKSVETPLAGPDADGMYVATIGPFAGEQVVTAVDFVIHRADGGWDNNNGQDYHIAIAAEPPEPPPEAGPEPVADAGGPVDVAAPDTVQPVEPAPDAAAPDGGEPDCACTAPDGADAGVVPDAGGPPPSDTPGGGDTPSAPDLGGGDGGAGDAAGPAPDAPLADAAAPDGGPVLLEKGSDGCTAAARSGAGWLPLLALGLAWASCHAARARQRRRVGGTRG